MGSLTDMMMTKTMDDDDGQRQRSQFENVQVFEIRETRMRLRGGFLVSMAVSRTFVSQYFTTTLALSSVSY